jgi:hypothetical protein
MGQEICVVQLDMIHRVYKQSAEVAAVNHVGLLRNGCGHIAASSS